jgi:hypothetical protein
LIAWVRWRTKRSRVRNTSAEACRSALLTATKRIEGRCAASQIASALRLAGRPAAQDKLGRIVLAPPDEGLDVGRRDQPHLMAQPADLAPPVMRAAARLHRHHAGLQRSEKPQHLAAPQLLPQHHPVGRIGPVQLKNMPFDCLPRQALRRALARSSPIVLISLMDASSSGNFEIPTLAHQGREGASTPSTLTWNVAATRRAAIPPSTAASTRSRKSCE